MAQGRIIINTGDGKGKTTAALGTAFRALGHNQKVCVIQFLKGQGDYGERMMAKRIAELEWHICGKGFVFKKEAIEEDRRVAREGFTLARQKILSGNYDLIVLDEVTYLVSFDFIGVDDIVSLLKEKPASLSVILTGRNAAPELVEIADTVTECQPVKHAFETGIRAQEGIEF
ncbi:MAG: cob(I)yrinic acid a,c-diamide adenosyltransferase [Desulfobulbaceae bacterium]|nr:MAG: cob(I)yrinic acid a,c-diamide adenosyltransferase [Desulfobulbaceae bacterium]